MDRDEVEVHKNAKKERGQYPAILTEQAWSIKDLLYGIKHQKMIRVRVLFSLFSFSLTHPVFSFSSSIDTQTTGNL